MRVWTQIFNQVSQLRIKSVVDSLLKFGILVLVLAVVGAIFNLKDWILIILFSFAGLLIIVGIIFYIYFALKNPDYLRSETFQLRKQAVEFLGDNERSTNPNIQGIPMVTNPFRPESDEKDNPMLD